MAAGAQASAATTRISASAAGRWLRCFTRNLLVMVALLLRPFDDSDEIPHERPAPRTAQDLSIGGLVAGRPRMRFGQRSATIRASDQATHVSAPRGHARREQQ